MNCTETQIKNFFAALCYANKLIAVFEKQLIEVPEKELPNILLASIIFENCGLARIKEYMPDVAKSTTAYWFPIPNQYILRDRAWLYPVIRACDPDRSTFTDLDLDYGARIIENIENCLGVSLKYKDQDVIVDLRQCLQMIAYVIAHPEVVGMTQREMNDVMTNALTVEIFHIIKSQRVDDYYLVGATSSENNDLSQGLQALGFMIALFVSSCLLIGYYWTSN